MEQILIKDSPIAATMTALAVTGQGGWLMALLLSQPAAHLAETERTSSSLDADLAHTPHH